MEFSARHYSVKLKDLKAGQSVVLTCNDVLKVTSRHPS
ncbi:hypothetical protein PGR6_35700 [Pseudomonas sp. GR 6-02]|nr:hypothetical protein PGR6_35700 [Pseudomonas sp. GR 6-02]